MSLPPKLGFLLIALIGSLVGIGATYRALSNELSGVAVYSKYQGGSRLVSRESSPSEFRYATNQFWFIAVPAFVFAVIGFRMYRKLDAVV